jgi:hypothetical protein
MSETKWNTKKLVAGTAAVVLTLAAAGAAIAVNLDTADPASSSPAGRLSATEPIAETTTAVTPSTVYVDEVVTVPSSPATAATPSPGEPSPAPVAPVPGSGGSAPSYDDDHRDERDDEDGEHEEQEHEEQEQESEHEDGADDDD